MNSVPPIFLLHGALGAADQMAPVAQALESLAPVHRIDWPGHGVRQLQNGEKFSLAGFVDALAEHIAHPGHVKPIAFGHSMGGYVALALESRSPGTFAGIVTLGTKFEWTPANAERECARLDALNLIAKVPRFAQTLETRHEHAGGWQLVLQRTAALLRENARDPLLNTLSLGGVRIPAVIAVGSRDDTVSWEETQRAASAMKNASSVLLHDVSHPIERVSPVVAVDLVRSLIAM